MILATSPIALDPIILLSRDLTVAARTLSAKEARYLVKIYYILQEGRKAATNQSAALDKSDPKEPHAVLDWVSKQSDRLENSIRKALDAYSDVYVPGQWAKAITGIGPVIAAGLLAHIDITKAPTVSSIWKFAGLDPTQEWKEHEKRPWNAELRTLAWKIGQSFVYVQNKPNDFYGELYVHRKEVEIERNNKKEFADQAAEKLRRFKIDKSTEAYKWYSQGMLPPAHIHQRACRLAAKIFLSHYHYVAYETFYHVTPPKPYVFDYLGHVHFIPVPNWPFKP